MNGIPLSTINGIKTVSKNLSNGRVIKYYSVLAICEKYFAYKL